MQNRGFTVLCGAVCVVRKTLFILSPGLGLLLWAAISYFVIGAGVEVL